jgi:hypothetical protein
VRSSGLILEGTGSFVHIAIDLFVSGFARNIVALAKFGEGKSLSSKVGDELNFLVHR